MGEVITFAGLYAADKGQAAAVTFYTFVGEPRAAWVRQRAPGRSRARRGRPRLRWVGCMPTARRAKPQAWRRWRWC